MSIRAKGTDTVDVILRVRYADTDQMSVAYHSNYLIWFEVARTSYCRACGATYADLERHFDTFLPVIEVQCRYRRPLRYDDAFLVRAWIERPRTRAVSFGYHVLSEDGTTLLADGMTRHVVTDSEGRPRRLSHEVRQRLMQPRYSTGETPV